MKYIIILQMLFTMALSSILDINSFEADFKQIITDDKGKELSYSGHIVASKPQYALWSYKEPVEKNVYITPRYVTVVEPEIEQAIVRKIASDFDFFNMIKKAKKKRENIYVATLNESKYTIKLEKSMIKSISYLDEFENNVSIVFNNQSNNKIFSEDTFRAKIPVEYDIIRD
ncbi:MAG: LolA-like outer membrane lipoprotein chaperone [Campylobacterota bacterium]